MTVSAEFPFESKYIVVNGVRMHYIEEGPSEGPVFLFIHGNPTWSYLWRNVIPPVAKHARCVAFDLVGFGYSERPDIGYTFLDHDSYIEGFIKALDLRDIVIVGHDWGGALGFHYASNHPENVRGFAAMETFCFTFKWEEFPKDFKAGFKMFRTPIVGKFMIMALNIFVDKIIPKAIAGGISPEVHEQYKKQFPTIRSRYPVWVWPNEIPLPDRKNETYHIFLELEKKVKDFSFPILLFTSTPGGIISPAGVEWLKERIQDLTIKEFGPGFHYLQEDNPQGIADGVVEWARSKGLIS